MQGGDGRKVRARLCLIHSGGKRVLATTELGTCSMVGCHVKGAAINLRLIEQACSYSTVQGRDQLKVRARLRLLHSSGGECFATTGPSTSHVEK